ncbi:MAG: hypothetical protein UX37_C0011G0001 [Microgenomates group bacterium GW2011_GWA2_46_16]|nr:MAG: hypothetical protein UX37_C0011G0001 [Microgenomates group bacterium GW2011_GWA2_46_16]
MDKQLVIFEDKQIRRVWDELRDTWYFSVIDIIAVLVGQPDFQLARNYWKVLKNRLSKEGSEVVTKCNRLKLMATDGKFRFTDCADLETIFRLIQSVPSPKTEPFKLWLAKVGHERIQEIADPERSINRGRANWQKLGRSKKWIQQRMMGQEIRNKLTDYWKSHEITKEQEYAILTDIIHSEWADVSVKQHKAIKGLKNQNLRNHMTDAELVFTALAELSTREIAETDDATGMEENARAGRVGGRIAKNARVALESKTGKKVISPTNYLSPRKTKLII